MAETINNFRFVFDFTYLTDTRLNNKIVMTSDQWKQYILTSLTQMQNNLEEEKKTLMYTDATT